MWIYVGFFIDHQVSRTNCKGSNYGQLTKCVFNDEHHFLILGRIYAKNVRKMQRH
jgi:hypothetical protein